MRAATPTTLSAFVAPVAEPGVGSGVASALAGGRS